MQEDSKAFEESKANDVDVSDVDGMEEDKDKNVN